MALVSKKSIDLSFANHYVDSLFVSDFAKKHLKGSVIHDVGTGAGFPGFITAIRNPDVTVILYERSLKKQTFLTAVQSQLNLPNVRLEGDLTNVKREGLFLARAVLPKDELFPFMVKRMTLGSRLIVNSGGSTEPFIPENHFLLLDQMKYSLPLDCGDRRVECFERK